MWLCYTGDRHDGPESNSRMEVKAEAEAITGDMYGVEVNVNVWGKVSHETIWE